MNNNLQKNVMVDVEELTRLATYGGSDEAPQTHGAVISVVTVATKVITKKVTVAVTKKYSVKVSAAITGAISGAYSASKA